jgi:hypothetical protein
MTKKPLRKGYRGFSSKKEYEAYYSDPKNYASELSSMEAYSREADAERTLNEDDEIT